VLVIYIVLPAYNEVDNVSVLLQDIAQTLAELMPVSEVLAVVVNDGSKDGTGEAVQACKAQLLERFPRFKVELLDHSVNRGLAEAIKSGLLYCVDKAAPQDIIVTMDCDNSHIAGLIPRLARRIFEGYDVIIASRYVPGAKIVGLSWKRKVLSSVASMIFRVLFPIAGVRDYTCGFRAYRAGLLIELFRQHPETISESGFSVMIDILLKVYRFDPGLAFGEVPLLLRYDKKEGASKMNVRLTTLQTLSLLVRRRMGIWDR